MKRMGLSNYLTQLLELQSINASSRSSKFELVICYLQIKTKSSTVKNNIR